jgi:hypothetical protein
MFEHAQTMDLKGLTDILKSLSELQLIKYLAIITAVVTGVGRVVLWLFVLVYDFLRFKLIPIAKAYQITLEVRRNEILGLADFYCLIVRYGSDGFLRDLATDNDRKDGKLQLRIKRCRLKYDKEGNASLRFELPVHRRIGTQFKCFAEPKAGCADKVLNILKSCSKLSDVEHSQSIHSDRIYFLLNKPYAQVYSSERLVGKRIVNNFVFPE